MQVFCISHIIHTCTHTLYIYIFVWNNKQNHFAPPPFAFLSGIRGHICPLCMSPNFGPGLLGGGLHFGNIKNKITGGDMSPRPPSKFNTARKTIKYSFFFSILKNKSSTPSPPPLQSCYNKTFYINCKHVTVKTYLFDCEIFLFKKLFLLSVCLVFLKSQDFQ